MVLKARWFLFLIIVAFLTSNIVSSLTLNLIVTDAFENSLLQSLISSLSFLFAFVMITRHYVSRVSPLFWTKFVLLALILFSIYAFLALAFGEPLLSAMGFEVTPVPSGSPLSPSEYGILAFYTYGLSSITNGLLSVAVAYWLQKYMVRGIFYAFKRVTKYRHFFETDVTKSKSSILVYVLWLILLPFPIQNVLSPNPVGVSVLGTSMYLLVLLALFAMWGLGLAALVAVTDRNLFRLHGAFRESLLWFLAIQWFSALVYASVAPPLLVNSLVKWGLLLLRVLFAYGPPALITAFLYKRVFEKRAETRIVEYLRQKEQLETAKIQVKAE